MNDGMNILLSNLKCKYAFKHIFKQFVNSLIVIGRVESKPYVMTADRDLLMNLKRRPGKKDVNSIYF